MMFSVGYPLTERDAFIKAIEMNCDSIGEVYFPWPGVPTGRSCFAEHNGYIFWDAHEQLITDLLHFRELGLKLNLLLNGNCYGAGAVSVSFERMICSIIAHLIDRTGGVETVTTTSPFVAFVIKNHYDSILVKASVNMRIGSIAGMEYLQDLFDGFCIQREYNRDKQHLGQLHQWAASHGKTLDLLVNSGCLNFCSNQTFHDNLVAHESELSGIENVKEFNPVMCWRYLNNPDHKISLLLHSNWIRPEDIHHYEDLFPMTKLATRLHAHPERVINAYVQGSFKGNLLDLLEPGLASLFYPYILSNNKFPAEWFRAFENRNNEKKLRTYCESVLAEVMVKLNI